MLSYARITLSYLANFVTLSKHAAYYSVAFVDNLTHDSLMLAGGALGTALGSPYSAKCKQRISFPSSAKKL